jgi:hypothetical protein
MFLPSVLARCSLFVTLNTAAGIAHVVCLSQISASTGYGSTALGLSYVNVLGIELLSVTGNNASRQLTHVQCREHGHERGDHRNRHRLQRCPPSRVILKFLQYYFEQIELPTAETAEVLLISQSAKGV